MTFDDILSDLYRRHRYDDNPAAKVVTRLRAFVNETQQELAEDPRLASLVRGDTTFTTVAGQAAYGLPSMLTRITKVRDTANRWALRQESLEWYRDVWADQTSEGTPDRYVLLGPKPVKAQPSAATGVWAVSSSGSDSMPVYLEAIRTGGLLHQPPATTLTGTTRVQLGTQTDYEEITDVYLSSACVGDVSLYDDASSGTVLGVIPKGQTRATYPWIAFAPTPSAARTYGIDYERLVTDLVNKTDEPYWLPASFHRLLALGARKKEYEYQSDDRVTVAALEFEKTLLKLVAFVNAPPDYVLIPGRVGSRRSDLGAGYPAGTIWD